MIELDMAGSTAELLSVAMEEAAHELDESQAATAEAALWIKTKKSVLSWAARQISDQLEGVTLDRRQPALPDLM